MLSHRAGLHRLQGMGLLAVDNAELWASVGVLVATVLLLAPGIVYAWYVLENWIGDGRSYARVIESITKP